MYWLLETKEQVDILYNSGYKEAFIEVIPYNNNVHPTQNGVSLVYIRPIQAKKGFMLCMDHSETLNGVNQDIDKVLRKFNKLYCKDKKELLHYFPLKSLIDINTPPTTYQIPTTSTHEFFYRKYGKNKKINKLIPVVKHYEVCEKIFNDLKGNITKPKNEYDNFFNNKTTMVFNAIERSGIHIHKPTFEEYFHPVRDEFIYTQFNLKTTTTRPSNKFKNVNYAALNKENGCRKSFIPRNNRFVEIDISAYHPSLVSHLIGYVFPNSDIHSHFASLYGVDYKKAKELTFKQLYGGVFENFKNLEFFQKTTFFIENMWEKFNNEGFVEVPISKYLYFKDKLDNMNPQKLFNYILQGLETSQNVLILWDIFRILRGKKTKLVLYTYDSFLLDLDDEDNILDDIRDVFKKYNLNIKEVSGNNYHELT